MAKQSILTIFLVVFTIRLLNALTIRTFFQADEYWQALEPAHYAVFNTGYLTWEWKQKIRSFLHPLIFAVAYKVCELFNLEYAWVLALPKVFSAFMVTIGEVGIYTWVDTWTGNTRLAQLTLAASLVSAFNWFAITRTFSNTFELVLTAWALNFWPIGSTISSSSGLNFKRFAFSLGLACFSCLVRPTNGVIWLVLGGRLFWVQKSKVSILLLVTLVTTACIIINASVDHWFYGELVFPLLKFLEFNVVQGLSAFYGINSWSFYVVQGVPILLLTLLPFTFHGVYILFGGLITDLTLRKKTHILVEVVCLYLLVFSLIQHKEFRFVYPLKPIFLLLTAISVTRLSKTWNPQILKTVTVAIVGLNIFLGYYFTIIHESGVIEVINVLRTAVLNEGSNYAVKPSIGFLTPCHSTPFQSHFHLDPDTAHIWFLTCEPPLVEQHEPGFVLEEYQDESDEFYADPTGFLDSNFRDISTGLAPEGKYPHDWPKYLVFFEALESTMNGYLGSEHYVPYARLFNSRFHWDERRAGDVIVYKRV
ncbi:unnamed protein product [Kuraishia capsulata CBS 1993]|uniref:Mannosyltransferase n=1 Tax=Kuraishia capsulata CBS 1993 TaxID=1382522 RepID=W6MPH0_9ASCO|nr:uncharacterized protein KUCA_T00004205001 [Kuraishia capsulata CBS 1993]CDK28223.1 unnamed protein product [Kuraishia capsulata CBS 1993]